MVKSRIYNTKTDVYSFGVLIFEVFSFAEFPFDAIYEDDKFIQFLANDAAPPLHTQLVFNVFEGVKDPPKRVMQLLVECVSRNPSVRPSFESIADRTAKPQINSVRVRLRTADGGGGGGGGTNIDPSGVDAVPGIAELPEAGTASTLRRDGHNVSVYNGFEEPGNDETML